MRAPVDFELDVWTVESLLDRIAAGKLGLPDFQRRFEWSTTDVRAFLSTVLGGLPSGAIMIASNDSVRLALRELEGAPPISGYVHDVLALLDGQQRLTALLHAALDIGPDEYFVNFSALADGGNVLEDDVVISRRRGRAGRNWADDTLVPYSALMNDHTFYGWLSAIRDPSAVRRWGQIFSNELQPIGRYRIPVTLLGGELDLAMVAQIFERTNKWGTRLDAFDLLVARLQSGGWSLRKAWERASAKYPSITRVFGENGLPTVSAIALRELKDVRRNSVLSLPPGTIEREWEPAVAATARVADLLISEGVRKPDLLAYDSLGTALIAATLGGTSEDLLIRYYWLAAMNRWHESASNTRVVSDFKNLLQNRLDPAMPTSLPEASELAINTRRSSRALWCAMVSAMLTVEPRDLVTSEPVTSPEPEREDTWQLVPVVTGGGRVETSADIPARLRTAAQVIVLPGLGTRVRRHGLLSVLRSRESQPSLFNDSLEEDMTSQLLPPNIRTLEQLSPREIIDRRAAQIRMLVLQRLS